MRTDLGKGGPIWENEDQIAKEKDWKPLEVRDEDNTKSELNITNNPLCPEGSRVVKNQTLL